MRAPRTPVWLSALSLAASMAACQGQDVPDSDPTPRATDRSCEAGAFPATATARHRAEPSEPALRQELLEMRDADQAERTGQVAANNDAQRAARLRNIIEQHGWPVPGLVGVDGSGAAWLIAQHADFDVEFQREVLGLMCAALATGDADPTEVAFLVDRVAVNSGVPQVFGTQMGGCRDGKPVPRPIADEQRMHDLRRQVGLQPYDEYLALFEEGCAAEGGD
jgi:hypothetical protein